MALYTAIVKCIEFARGTILVYVSVKSARSLARTRNCIHGRRNTAVRNSAARVGDLMKCGFFL